MGSRGCLLIWRVLTPLEILSGLGDKALKFQVICPQCPQNKTAVLKGFSDRLLVGIVQAIDFDDCPH